MQDFFVTDAATALPEPFIVQDQSRLDIDDD
jgi:hypothetical protein